MFYIYNFFPIYKTRCMYLEFRNPNQAICLTKILGLPSWAGVGTFPRIVRFLRYLFIRVELLYIASLTEQSTALHTRILSLLSLGTIILQLITQFYLTKFSKFGFNFAVNQLNFSLILFLMTGVLQTLLDNEMFRCPPWVLFTEHITILEMFLLD